MKAGKQSTRKSANAKEYLSVTTPARKSFLVQNREGILLGLLILLTIAVYSPTLTHSFTNWDDNDYVTENPYIKSLSAANVRHIFTTPLALNYHPLTMLSLAWNYRVSGEEPWSYFLVNILLHLCNTVLVFYLGIQLPVQNRAVALFVAAVFALHPMHVESVAWVSERKDVLYAFFFLGGLIAWIRFTRTSHWKWYLAALLLSLLSALSKPSAVVFPLILWLIDYLERRRFTFRLIAEKFPFLVVSVAIGLATLNAQVGNSVVGINHYNLVQQMLFASYGFFIYIFKLVIPAGLSALHPVPVFNTTLDLPWIYYATPAFNLVIIALVVYSLKFSRVFLFGILFYFVNIALTLQFMQVGSAVIAERYTYLSYIGLLMVVAGGISYLLQKHSKSARLVYPVMVIITVMIALFSIGRVAVWKNSETLWTDVIAKYPDSYTAFNNRGYALVKANQLERALPDFSRSIELKPSFVDALNNRGSLYRLQNEYGRAVADYSSALGINPDHVKALTGRANAYEALGKLDSALRDFDRAYNLNPALAMTLGDRGGIYFKMGRYEEAIAECGRKIEADPSGKAAYLNRAVAYSSLGKWEAAVADYSVVIAAGTDNPLAYEWRGVAYRNLGLLQQATDDFSAGIKMDPARASLYINRSMAYKQAGKPELAEADAKMAAELQSRQGN